MKALLFCTCYMEKENVDNNKIRYDRWISYYQSQMTEYGVDMLVLIDDGSSVLDFDSGIGVFNVADLPETITNQVNVFTFKDHFGRPSHHDYRGWWRSFGFCLEIAKKYGFDKIIHIESDFFVVSNRLIEYIKHTEFGWVALYSPFNKFPESGIQIIHQDSFSSFGAFFEKVKSKLYHIERSAELCLPFSYVENKFLGDRFGQLDVMADWLNRVDMPAAIDYVGQVSPSFSTDDFEPYFTFERRWK